MTRIRLSALHLLLLFLAGCATAPLQTAVTAPAARAAAAADLKADWWRDNRWRYHDEGEADEAYARLLDRQSPWPEWHQVQIVTLPPGLRFEMALAPGQPTDRPGAFGTFDR